MRLAIIILLLGAAFLSIPAEAKEIEEHIYIVPAGLVDERPLEYLKSNLPDSFPMAVNAAIGARQDIPRISYNPSKNQYNATIILSDISERVTIDMRNERILVVVDVDLYTLESDHVAGLSDAKKGVSIISLYGIKWDDSASRERLVKEAARELAHSWGLADCSNPRCVMYASDKMPDIDKKRNTFCHDCGNKLYRRYHEPLIKNLHL